MNMNALLDLRLKIIVLPTTLTKEDPRRRPYFTHFSHRPNSSDDTQNRKILAAGNTSNRIDRKCCLKKGEGYRKQSKKKLFSIHVFV